MYAPKSVKTGKIKTDRPAKRNIRIQRLKNPSFRNV